MGLSADDLRTALEVLLKLGLSAVLGGAIGWERELHGRPAGVRTHMLMVIGVVLFAEVSKAFGGQDTGRIAAQIVTGVGFLGAGTILRTGMEIKGLTTAASIWCAAAIGMAISVGGAFFVVASVATLLALVTLTVVDNLERRFAPDIHARELLVQVRSREETGPLIERIEKSGGKVEGVRINVLGEGFLLRLRVTGSRNELMQTVLGDVGVMSAEWSD